MFLLLKNELLTFSFCILFNELLDCLLVVVFGTLFIIFTLPFLYIFNGLFKLYWLKQLFKFELLSFFSFSMLTKSILLFLFSEFLEIVLKFFSFDSLQYFRFLLLLFKLVFLFILSNLYNY